MDELGSSLSSDARDTGNIVCAVAGQGENFPDLRRFNAPFFLDLPRTEESEGIATCVRFCGRIDGDMFACELKDILVVGRDDYVMPRQRRLCGCRKR